MNQEKQRRGFLKKLLVTPAVLSMGISAKEKETQAIVASNQPIFYEHPYEKSLKLCRFDTKLPKSIDDGRIITMYPSKSYFPRVGGESEIYVPSDTLLVYTYNAEKGMYSTIFYID